MKKTVVILTVMALLLQVFSLTPAVTAAGALLTGTAFGNPQANLLYSPEYYAEENGSYLPGSYPDNEDTNHNYDFDLGEGNEKRITKIRFVARDNYGKILGNSFYASVNGSTYIPLQTFCTSRTNQWVELAVNNPTRFRYLRWSDEAWPAMHSVQWYGTGDDADLNAEAQLTGGLFGEGPGSRETTTGAKPDLQTWWRAFDGNTATFPDMWNDGGVTAYLKLDLGKGVKAQVTRLQYAPRPDYAGRMRGAKLEGSLNGVNYETVYTVPGDAPIEVNQLHELPVSSAKAYRYYRFEALSNAAELYLYGKYEFSNDDTPPVLTGQPTVTGNNYLGQTLAASYTVFDEDGDDTSATTVAWYRSTGAETSAFPVGWVRIDGADADAYTLTAADLYQYVVCAATPRTANPPAAGATVVSKPRLIIAEADFPLFGTLSGNPEVDKLYNENVTVYPDNDNEVKNYDMALGSPTRVTKIRYYCRPNGTKLLGNNSFSASSDGVNFVTLQTMCTSIWNNWVEIAVTNPGRFTTLRWTDSVFPAMASIVWYGTAADAPQDQEALLTGQLSGVGKAEGDHNPDPADIKGWWRSFDGDYRTFPDMWNDDGVTAYLKLDLGEGVKAQATRLQYAPRPDASANRIRGAKLEGSLDGVTYETIYAVPADAPIEMNQLHDLPINTVKAYRYYRFEALSNAAELRLHGVYGEGETVTKPTLRYSGGSVDVVSPTPLSGAQLIVACYSRGSGPLTGIKIYPISSQAFERVTRDAADLDAPAGGRIRVMLWEGLDTMAPTTADTLEIDIAADGDGI